MPRAIPAVIFVTLVMLALALALWHLSFVLLLAFFGLLIAVLLRHMALMISGHTSLSASAALGIVVLALLTLIGLGIYYLGAQIAGQRENVRFGDQVVVAAGYDADVEARLGKAGPSQGRVE